MLPSTLPTPSPSATRAPVHIRVDARERSAPVCAALERMADVQLAYARLPSGDYVLSERVAVERKTASDLVSSIADRRLFDQAARLRLSFERPVLLVEGDLAGVTDRMNLDALQGALSALVVRLGITVLQVADADAAAAQLRSLARHATGSGEAEFDLRARKPAHERLAAEYLVQGLPGVGARRARQLLAHFGSAGAVLGASRDRLLEVPGIGATLADRLLTVLHASWAETG